MQISFIYNKVHPIQDQEWKKSNKVILKELIFTAQSGLQFIFYTTTTDIVIMDWNLTFSDYSTDVLSLSLCRCVWWCMCVCVCVCVCVRACACLQTYRFQFVLIVF